MSISVGREHPAQPAAPASGAVGSPVEYALLGLILLSGGDAHGYELARHFGSAQPLGKVVRVELAMVYHHLKKLSRTGSIVVTPEPSHVRLGRPSRQRCRVTAAGRDEFFGWLSRPPAPVPECWPEFLVKFFLAAEFNPELALQLVKAEQMEQARLQSVLTGRLACFDERPEVGSAAEFDRLLLRLHRAQTSATIEWLHDAAAWCGAQASPGIAPEGPPEAST